MENKLPVNCPYCGELVNYLNHKHHLYMYCNDEKPKTLLEGVEKFKEKHGAIFENKSYMELKQDDEKEALLTDFLNWYIKRYTDDAKDDIQYFTDATGLQIPIGMIIEHYLTRKQDLI